MIGTGDQRETRDLTDDQRRHTAETLWRYCDGYTSPELATVLLTEELSHSNGDDFTLLALEQAQDALRLARVVTGAEALAV